MASIVFAVEVLRLPPSPRDARRQLLIFHREALRLIATLILLCLSKRLPIEVSR